MLTDSRMPVVGLDNTLIELVLDSEFVLLSCTLRGLRTDRPEIGPLEIAYSSGELLRASMCKSSAQGLLKSVKIKFSLKLKQSYNNHGHVINRAKLNKS